MKSRSFVTDSLQGDIAKRRVGKNDGEVLGDDRWSVG